MIVTVGNTKGGVGKTTIALNLAIARAISGRDVWLVDGDPQGTVSSAISLRSVSELFPPIACSAFSTGQALRDQVKQQGGKFQDVIIDAGGRDSSALRAALVLTDVLLVPFQPRSFDVWALNDIAELVTEVRGVRDGLRALAVLSMADPASSADNADAAAAVADLPAFEYVNTPIRRRKAFSNSAGEGRSVLELKPQDPKATAEIQALIAAVFNI